MLVKDNVVYDLLNYKSTDADNIDYDMDRYCEAYCKVIDYGTCMTSLMCLNGDMKISSFEELEKIKDIEKARNICRKCVFSNV